MNVYCADDSPSHLMKIKEVVEAACQLENKGEPNIMAFEDGADLLDAIQGNQPDLITLDINMPRLDGLSTLSRLRGLNVSAPIIMASSEAENVIKRHAKTEHFDADEDKKQEMLERVIQRVRSGKIEAGKINSVLEACGSLGMDPVKVAKQLGATAFLKKPYDIEEAARKLSSLLFR